MHCLTIALIIVALFVIWMLAHKQITYIIKPCCDYAGVFTYFDGTGEECRELCPDKGATYDYTLYETFKEGFHTIKEKIFPQHKRNIADIITYSADPLTGINYTTDAEIEIKPTLLGDLNAAPVPVSEFVRPAVDVSGKLTGDPLDNLTSIHADWTPGPVEVPDRIGALLSDIDYWTIRECKGAHYTGMKSRPNNGSFCGRHEDFLTQPDEAFDAVRTAGTMQFKSKPGSYENVYKEVICDKIGINEIAPDDCEISVNNYLYKESCPYQMECY